MKCEFEHRIDCNCYICNCFVIIIGEIKEGKIVDDNKE